MALHLDDKIYTSEVLTKIWEHIDNAQKITLLTHFRPDGDGISACAAMETILLKSGKYVETVYPSETEFKVPRCPKNILINSHKETPDLIIIFDTANEDRVYAPNSFKEITSINIDHHISNSIPATINILDFKASSACEVLYNIIALHDETLITTYIAECLLFGILSDSQAFHTQNTTANTLRIGADLVDRGANLFELKTELLSHKDPNIIKLWGYMLENISISKHEKAAWSVIRQEELAQLNLTLGATIGFNNFLAEISGVDVTVLFTETDDGKTKVSLRSKKTDVNKIAAYYGGGGHKNASGILIDTPIDEVVKTITNVLEAI